MKYKFNFHIYSRKFKNPLITSHGPWEVREGILIRLEDKHGRVGLGEIAPIPFFNTETIQSAKTFCSQLDQNIRSETIKEIPKLMGCTRYAFEIAHLQIQKKLPQYIATKPITRLLPPGEAALDFLAQRAYKESTIFKWKMGIYGFDVESKIFEKLVHNTAHKNTFRLDANEGLSLEETKQWLTFLDTKPVEFLEQPMPKGQEYQMDVLHSQYKTRLALDESVLGLDELKDISESGWQGFLTVKPSLIIEAEEFLNWRNNCKCPLIYSTALETAVGTENGLAIASSDTKNDYALGFGVDHFFSNDEYATLDEIRKIWKKQEVSC